MHAAIVFLPLIGAFLSGLFGRQLGPKWAPITTCVLMVACCVLAWIVFFDITVAGNVREVQLFTWIDSGAFEVDWALYFDQVTAVMLVVVTTVSMVVHIYSIGYMEHDPHRQRFFAYLSLFTFSMLMLVTADNFVQLFFGWEGVGLCSYLLIGFWYKRPSANAAAIKAFVVNRVGDFGFALGIMGVFLVYNAVSFDAVFNATPDVAGSTFTFLNWEVDTLTTLCLLLFVGAMGKSAQVPLHTWLPDAMEGPTPVSALIHAATMVTAGVFMVVRLSPMFEYAPYALMFVCFIGATTAFFAATIGIAQNDIKRVIAYSTCSQLGYMFFACGVGAYAAALFHLAMHACFKALLFLGSGQVIHAMHDEQDMRRMGGLWRKIPITYTYMWIGSLALAGIPFFAGYFSKDLIIESAFAVPHQHGALRLLDGRRRRDPDRALFLAADLHDLPRSPAHVQGDRGPCARSAQGHVDAAFDPGSGFGVWRFRLPGRRHGGRWRHAVLRRLHPGARPQRHRGSPPYSVLGHLHAAGWRACLALPHGFCLLHLAARVARSHRQHGATDLSAVCSTSTTSTSFMTGCSCARPSGSAAVCGRRSTVR